ncbi:MAG: DNA recombination protein RmuC [Candidatus Freyarchaeota archaeon]|nr:DNA recombination protein RmuC [Candidatus Jordarchaeia archaeon]
MLIVPSEGGLFGELALEAILSDQLLQIFLEFESDGKIPVLLLTLQLVLFVLDSKFPLENYRKIMETENLNEKEKKSIRSIF